MADRSTVVWKLRKKIKGRGRAASDDFVSSSFSGAPPPKSFTKTIHTEEEADKPAQHLPSFLTAGYITRAVTGSRKLCRHALIRVLEGRLSPLLFNLIVIVVAI